MGGGVEGLFFYFGEQGGERDGRTAGEGRGLFVEMGREDGWRRPGGLPQGV
jgi:hypothetical protein